MDYHRFIGSHFAQNLSKHKMNNKELGSYGENLAISFIIEKGYEILAKNYKCRIGEIDIIARNSAVLVFIEVKTRRTDSFGFPSEAVNKKKRTKLLKLAMFYLALNKAKPEQDYRFDVIEVKLNKDNTNTINHIINAFEN